jgi:hypothetical protein
MSCKLAPIFVWKVIFGKVCTVRSRLHVKWESYVGPMWTKNCIARQASVYQEMYFSIILCKWQYFIYYILRLHNSLMVWIYHTFFLLYVSAWWGHLQVYLGFLFYHLCFATLPTLASVHTLGVRGVCSFLLFCPFVKCIIYMKYKTLKYYIIIEVRLSKIFFLVKCCFYGKCKRLNIIKLLYYT